MKKIFTHYKKAFKNLNWKFVIFLFVALNGVNMLDGIYFSLRLNIGLALLVLFTIYAMGMENAVGKEKVEKEEKVKENCPACGQEITK